MSDLLKKCLEAGSVMALFPLMASWSKEDLLALQAELDQSYADASVALNDHWGKLAMEPSNFFSSKRASNLDEAKHQAELQLLGVHAEISSVVCFFLEGDE